MLIALAGALAIGLSLGLLGSGGSILTVPVLHYLLGQPDQEAIGGSLLVVGLIAAAAAVPHARAGRIEWRNVLWFGAPGMLGAWLGAGLAHWIPGTVQLVFFALTMLVAAVRMLFSKPITQAAAQATARPGAVLAGGFGVGLLSGMVGVGGGFLIVPALVLLARVPLASAVGTSLAIITINATTGFVKYVGVLDAKGITLDWPTLLLVAAVGIVGSLAGHRLGRHLPQRLLGRIFGSVLIALAVAITIELAGRQAG